MLILKNLESLLLQTSRWWLWPCHFWNVFICCNQIKDNYNIIFRIVNALARTYKTMHFCVCVRVIVIVSNCHIGYIHLRGAKLNFCLFVLLQWIRENNHDSFYLNMRKIIQTWKNMEKKSVESNLTFPGSVKNKHQKWFHSTR